MGESIAILTGIIAASATIGTAAADATGQRASETYRKQDNFISQYVGRSAQLLEDGIRVSTSGVVDIKPKPIKTPSPPAFDYGHFDDSLPK